MDCLNNFIGISAACTQVTPISNQYIEDLEGVSIKSLAAVEGGKYFTAQNLINEKMRVVGNKLVDRLGLLIGDISIEQSTDAIISRGFSEDSLTGSSGNPGLIIEKKASVFTKLFIPRLYFKSATAVSGLDITVDDGHQSQVFIIDADANEEVVIEANFLSGNLQVDVSYPAVGPSHDIEPYTGTISPYHRYDCSSCGYGGSHYLKMKGIDFDGEESSSWYGIRADVQLVCDREKMICLVAKRNPMLFLYALGVELANEAIASDRLNFLAMNNRDWWSERGKDWASQFNELWLVNGDGIRSFLQGQDSSCFTCTGVHVRYSTG